MTDQQAVRAYIDWIGGPATFAHHHSLNKRTAERIYSGAGQAPEGLQMEIRKHLEVGALILADLKEPQADA